MIIWKLRQLMEDRRITGKELAERVGKHYNTIYRLRESDEMPSIDGDSLNKLCNALGCTLDALVEYIPDVQTSDIDSKPNAELPSNTAAAVTAATIAAIQATRAIGSTDSTLVSKIASSVAQIVLQSENNNKDTQ